LGYQTKAAVLILGVVCFLLTVAAAVFGSPPAAEQDQVEAQPLQEAGNTANATADAAETPEVPAAEPAMPGASSHEPTSPLEAAGKEPASARSEITNAGSEAVGAAVPASKRSAHEPRVNAAITTAPQKPAAKKAQPLTDESRAEVGKRTPTRAEPKPTPKALTHAKVAELKKANPGTHLANNLSNESFGQACSLLARQAIHMGRRVRERR